MTLIDICVNCPDAVVAERIAEALIKQRLVACANIGQPIHSLYRWQGKIEREQEVPLLLKTRTPLFNSVVDAVKTLHPYDVPSILALPVDQVNVDYWDWVRAETEVEGGVPK